MSDCVACVVLAAGRSARLGRPKQLLCIEGRVLVRRTVEVALASACDRVAVVLGAEADAVESALAGLSVATLRNAAWETGMASSLHVAVDFAEASGSAGLLVCVCDQPLLDAAHLDALRDTFLRSRQAVASTYAGVRGVPAILPRARFAALRGLRGDRGAASLLRDDPLLQTLAWPEGAVDLDTAADVARFEAGAR